VVIISASLILFLTAFGIYSSIMIVQISTQRNELERRNINLLIQESRYLSKKSADLLETDDRMGAISAALAALPTNGKERPWTPQAEFALSQALYAYQDGGIKIDRRLEHSSPVERVMFNRDGTRVVSSDNQNNLYIWDSISGERIGFFSARVDFRNWGFDLCDNNRLYVAAGLKFVCIDVYTAEILWEKEHETYIDYSMFGNNVILSKDGSIAALTSAQGVFFVSTLEGRLLFYQVLMDFSMKTFPDNNGTFSQDGKYFYISYSNSALFSEIGDDINPGTLFRINVESRGFTTLEFDDYSRILGIYADESMEIFVVSGYGDDGRDVLFAFCIETQVLLWEYVLSTNAGFRSNAFIYQHNGLVFVACGSAVVVVSASDGERITADTLSANVLHSIAIPELPDRIIAVLENGEVRLTSLKEDMLSPLQPIFGHWALAKYKNDLSAVSLLYDSTIEGRNIPNSMIYAFVPRNPRLHMGQPYIAIARYLEDDNFIGIDNDDLVSQLVISKNGEWLAFISGNADDGLPLFVADARTGEILFKQTIEANHSSNIKQLAFDADGNIIICAETWLIIIDWRNNTVVFKFDPSKVDSGDDGSFPPRWDVIVSGDFAFYSAGSGYDYFLVNIIERSYKTIAVDYRVSINLSQSALNNNGELAVFSTSFLSDDRLLLITPDSAQPRLIDDNFIGKENFRTDLFWSNDGSLLARQLTIVTRQ
jgi:WD40 repeat protein